MHRPCHSNHMHPRTLFIAYGNPDREDDGVGWYVLKQLAEHFNSRVSDWNEDFYSCLGAEPDFFFTLQLTPELQDLIVGYEYVCFIDAHLGDEFDDLELCPLEPVFEPSTLSHHMTPQFLMDITLASYRKHPQAVLLTIRGYEFQFEQRLSSQCHLLAEKAVVRATEWYRQISDTNLAN